MEDQIFRLKNDFENMKNIVDKIKEIKTAIKKKLSKLKEIHTELINANDSKKIFLICLESFHFQYKAMIFDSDNLKRNFILITNRAFCDYTSLYNLLQKMFDDYKIDIPTASMHPVYDDLDPYCEYKIEDIILAHDNSVELIMSLICKLRENENIVNKYKIQSKSGIRITNFINTLEYDNNILRDQIELYINYCEFFQCTQQKYFNKLLEKIKALQRDIDEDIKFQETQWDDTFIVEDDKIIQANGEASVSQWTTNPLILAHPVHHYESEANELTEPKENADTNQLTNINWGIAIEDLSKEDEEEESESKSPINKKKIKRIRNEFN